MTRKYLLDNMINMGDTLRTAQKNYFSEKDPVVKKEWLDKSKKAEKQFDNLLFNAKQLVSNDAVTD